MIKDNIERIRGRIFKACFRVGRVPDELNLVCVTKGRSIEEINEAVTCGLVDIGENKVQEAVLKYKQLSAIKWHMIGHLQSNKVKNAVSIFNLIHSVDSLDLAFEINKQSLKINKVQDILLEVKTSFEQTKFGFLEQDIDSAAREITQLSNLRILGLMTIAPLSDDPEDARSCFKQLGQIRKRINNDWLLSMGMSDDFEIAIEEGADILRIGRAIFENV